MTPPFFPVSRPESESVSFISANGMVWALFLGDSMGEGMEHAHDDLHEFANWQIGFLLQFISDSVKPMNADELLDHLEGAYGFPAGKMDGTINVKTGVYSYKGDPDLYPIAQVNTNESTVLVYAYGIVGIIDKNISSDDNHHAILEGKDIGAKIKVIRLD